MCSHISSTAHPIFLSSLRLFLSLFLLASNLETQKSLFDLGTPPWTGQECQKHPCTMTTTLSLGNTKSGLTCPVGVLILTCLRQPVTPRALMALARGTSVVPLPLERIRDIIRDLVAASTVSMQGL